MKFFNAVILICFLKYINRFNWKTTEITAVSLRIKIYNPQKIQLTMLILFAAGYNIF